MRFTATTGTSCNRPATASSRCSARRLRTGPSRMVNLACLLWCDRSGCGARSLAECSCAHVRPVRQIIRGKRLIEIIEETNNVRFILGDGACRSHKAPGTAKDRELGACVIRTGGVACAEAASEGITPDLVGFEVVGVHKFSKLQHERFARRLVRRGTWWSGYWYSGAWVNR